MDKIRTIKGGANLQGIIKVPGDKSISHRALIIASIAEENNNKWVFTLRGSPFNC